MTTLLQHVDRWRSNPLFGQMVRFGIAGGLSTVLYSAVYLPLTLYVFERQHAVYAVPFAFAVAVIGRGVIVKLAGVKVTA